MLPSFFREAEKASHFSDHPKTKMGACIMLKRRTISVGFNQNFKTHPLVRRFHEHQTIHAEVSAILRTKNKKLLKGATMIVYRAHRRTHDPILAKPCDICQEIMLLYGITKMIYTTDGSFEETRLTP